MTAVEGSEMSGQLVAEMVGHVAEIVKDAVDAGDVAEIVKDAVDAAEREKELESTDDSDADSDADTREDRNAKAVILKSVPIDMHQTGVRAMDYPLQAVDYTLKGTEWSLCYPLDATDRAVTRSMDACYDGVKKGVKATRIPDVLFLVPTTWAITWSTKQSMSMTNLLVNKSVYGVTNIVRGAHNVTNDGMYQMYDVTVKALKLKSEEEDDDGTLVGIDGDKFTRRLTM